MKKVLLVLGLLLTLTVSCTPEALENSNQDEQATEKAKVKEPSGG
ncbi:hypothetical protein [Kordia jejudonensis]|nr:hypothetical protein [Kordia jejudonensis]